MAKTSSLASSLLPLLLSLCALATAWPPPHSGGWPSGPSTSPWDLTKFETLVVFGDSYSDDSRLNYFSNHAGQAPPVAWVDPPVRTLRCEPRFLFEDCRRDDMKF